jgi:oligogalacturonide lyase
MMSKNIWIIMGFLLVLSCREAAPPVLETGGGEPMPGEWIDRDTHHRILRLTGPEGDNRSFYFHNPPFIPTDSGDLMVFYGSSDNAGNDQETRRGVRRQIKVVNLATGNVVQVTRHPNRIFGEIVSKSLEEVFFQAADTVFATRIGNPGTRVVYVFPDSLMGSVTTVSADGRLLGGVYSEKKKYEILRDHPRKGDYFNLIFEARIPHTLFIVDIDKGILQPVFSDTAWLNHVQFSPTDPHLLMFCHEGPWHLLDRIWTVDIRTGKPQLMHSRTVDREIAGHEFFSPDGKTIWFDLQVPRGETFFLAGLDLSSMTEKHYALTQNEWSIHFNISPDQSLFAGDGGDSTQVARATDGKWIYLFRPESDSLKSEKLVNMRHHDYDTEPNVHFSPDGKWIIFRANFEGSTQIYAVEVKRQR